MRFFAKNKGFLPLFSQCAAGLSDNCMTPVILRRVHRGTCPELLGRTHDLDNIAILEYVVFLDAHL